MASTKYTVAEESVNEIVKIFHNFSRQHGDKDALEKDEFGGLLKNEAPEFYKYMVKNNISQDDLFKKANLNNNTSLEFPEFMLVISMIAIEMHEKYHQIHGPEGPDGPEGPGHHGHGHTHHHHH
ncbi:protein S100-A8-like [Gracilinanus agilis]|uniref:protein S100-A8-like n=1 Tax=Gracilinanus agilis TaxID=191870 RepID=UPI001CFC972E|nr:protein S100-A8-like [Gracilinanus agilis]